MIQYIDKLIDNKLIMKISDSCVTAVSITVLTVIDLLRLKFWCRRT